MVVKQTAQCDYPFIFIIDIALRASVIMPDPRGES